MNGRVTVRMNVLGIDLAANQVDPLLANDSNTFERHRTWLASFFQLDNPSELIRAVLVRYSEADEVMARISAGANDEDIYARLIGTLVSAKRCYSNAEYIACIELCALHGEMLANYLCITERERLEAIFANLPERDIDAVLANKGSGIYFSDKFSQTLRLRWLVKANIVSTNDRKDMLVIHNLRIKYFHHWSPKRGNEKQDAIKALTVVSPVTAKFLEILGNTANFERVKRYMRIVSGQNYACGVLPRKMWPICDFLSNWCRKLLSQLTR